jgi:phytoene dehydrogenase-like protein
VCAEEEIAMSERHVVIVGGGLAGLSAGCYARASGFRTTVLEHNIALGGVCTAWPRGAYTVDGCIHCLTGGVFAPLYEELGIVPPVRLHVLKEWTAYRDARNGRTLHLTRDLDALARELGALAPEDGAEIGRIVAGARTVAELKHPLDQGHRSFWDHLAEFWQMRDEPGTVMRFRKPLALYVREHLRSQALQRIFTELLPPEALRLPAPGPGVPGTRSPLASHRRPRPSAMRSSPATMLGARPATPRWTDPRPGTRGPRRPAFGRQLRDGRRGHLHLQHAGDSAPAPRRPVRR